MSAKKLVAIREGLISTARQMGKSGASTAEVIAAFREANPNATDDLRHEIEDIAFACLLKEARTRRVHVNDNNQSSLFSSFKAPVQIVLKNDEGNKKHKNLEECSLPELDEYIASLPTRQIISTRKRDLLRLREAIEGFYGAKHDNVGKCWQAYLDTQPPS